MAAVLAVLFSTYLSSLRQGAPLPLHPSGRPLGVTPYLHRVPEGRRLYSSHHSPDTRLKLCSRSCLEYPLCLPRCFRVSIGSSIKSQWLREFVLQIPSHHPSIHSTHPDTSYYTTATNTWHPSVATLPGTRRSRAVSAMTSASSAASPSG